MKNKLLNLLKHPLGLLAAILLLDPDGLHLRLGAAPSLPESYGRAIDGIALELSASAAASFRSAATWCRRCNWSMA